MFSQEEHDELYRLACDWAKQQEAAIVALGSSLSERQLSLADGAGLQQPSRVRILAVPYIPIPDDEKLRAATVQTNMISRACRGIATGYGVMLRADCWSDRELLAHQLVHAAQYERAGGVEPFLKRYFQERFDSSGFSLGPLEQEARSLARTLASASS